MKNKKIKKIKKQVALIILDGWGHREELEHNAIAKAKTPNFDKYWSVYPHTLLNASGLSVGLPEGQMGNSEVGHSTIGAGKILDTDLVRIDKAIIEGDFEKNKAFKALAKHVKKYDSTLHVQGLLSDGGVHSHNRHLLAFLKFAKKEGIKKVAIHAFTDGRDVSPTSAGKYLKELENDLQEVGVGFIASVSGRFYAMDRDNNWDRLKKVEDVIFECKGNVCSVKPSERIESLYKEGKLDEHLEPMVCLDEKGESCKIEENDGVLFFNFRADRARMISQKILEKTKKDNICFVTMTEYSASFKCLVAFPPINIETTIAKEVSKAGLKQSHLAETEKFPHATYFLNGGVEKPYKGEKHILVPSRKDVPTHDLAPKMRAEEIAQKAIEEINKGVDFIFINFANPDMVGHTANVPAIVEAIEETDLRLGEVVSALEANGGVAFVTADHGNAETNVDKDGKPHTSHTLNKVPAIITDSSLALENGLGLANIAPTILTMLGIKIPKKMVQKSVIK